jgi:TolB-like protein
MNTKNLFSDREIFTDELVLKQVEKILLHPPFATSDILRKFLKYIINETLFGKPDQIKEYTIAVYVLNKPANFRPLNDGIVRVHARRLRDGLSSYYDDQRDDDICEISIPKGSYIPVFRSLSPEYSEPDVQINNQFASEPEEKMRIAIMPFKTFDENNSRLAFADNIGQMLSSQFSHFPNSRVLSYYTTQQLQLKNKEIKSIAADYGVNYVLVGNIHFESSRLRIVIQFINANTEMLIWSDRYMYDITKSDLFEMEDLIVSRVMNSMTELSFQFRKPAYKKSDLSTLEKPEDLEVIELKGNQRAKKIASF